MYADSVIIIDDQHHKVMFNHIKIASWIPHNLLINCITTCFIQRTFSLDIFMYIHARCGLNDFVMSVISLFLRCSLILRIAIL